MKSTSTNDLLLSVKNLEIEFDGKRVVENVSFDLERGETLAIVGESGSGKSTTINAVMGLLPGNGTISGGTVNFGSRQLGQIDLAKLASSKEPVDEKRFSAIRGKHIGLVPQDPLSNLNPVMTIGSQLREVLLRHGISSKSQATSKVVELLESVGLPNAGARKDQFPHEFSGGMRQRALIALGLACHPELLIADEPTSALDVTVQRVILDHLESLIDNLGTSMILVTHDLGLAAERAQRIIVMKQGKVIESGLALDVLKNPQEEYTKQLVEAAPSLSVARLDSISVIKPNIDESPLSGPQAEAPLLQVRGLSKTYSIRTAWPAQRKEFCAVDGVSFDLERGSTLGIVGESGSGKSTTARMILRLESQTKGTIRFCGADTSSLGHGGLKKYRREIQPVFQNPYGSFNPLRTIGDALEEPMKIFGIGSRQSRQNRVKELLALVALPLDTYDRYPGKLSGGQRQRAAIARALVLEPSLVVCDEPVSALDVLVQAQILALLKRLQEELGVSYLFISHDLAVVRQIAMNVLVMKDGKVIESGKTARIFDAPQHEYTKALLDAIPGHRLLSA